MTPKEKAKELVDSYKIKVKVFFTENSIPIIVKADMILESAIQCALIAVNELIKETGAKYWYDVKHELEKL